ncbi:NAD-dependent epimerase/dehydratase family protein [Nocardioides zeae]|uniref:NAD-dependent epimerase/dehydratase family protein n=1 Tax=Nocardioides imazamoxiresistens TaxID=3231893 RepID=A0ABU3Q1A0_9ACTN|nr:NAD-dependent epimerase/dehydratase family protein [Nocardioides zeae]MDT9594795.1 NAD-dependent epimerase/dehydratase family protein [Nocardioides zeae]
MGRVVLVTGVSRDLGRRVALSLVSDPDVDRVVGVDVVPPRGDIGAVSFVRADIRTPVIAKVIAREDVDTVVHMSVIASPGASGGRGAMKELNVIGTMQLLAACQKSETVRHLVVKSTTAVYGSSSRDPAMFTEDVEPRPARAGYAKDAQEVESYVRGFARRRPDVRVLMLRAANVVGPLVESPMTSYLRLPVVPTVIGFDPRLQFLHAEDVVEVLHHAVRSEVAGTFNVAGDGVLTLRQVLRRLQRPTVSLPPAAVGGLGRVVRQVRLAELSPELVTFLTYGRGVDTTRCRTELGFVPRRDTAAALEDFASNLAPTLTAPDRVLGAAERRLAAAGRGGGHRPFVVPGGPRG